MPNKHGSLDATTTGTFSIIGINTETPHTQITMRFLDSDGEITTPSGGTFTVLVKPDGSEVFQPVQLGTDITATDPLDALTYTAIGDEIKYEPNGITGAAKITFTVRSTGA